PAGKLRQVPIPSLFFSELLPLIDNLAELKVTLHIFWLLHQKRGRIRYARRAELLADRLLVEGLTTPELPGEEVLLDGLERAVARGTLLHVRVRCADREEEWYFLNSERGREAVKQIRQGRLADLAEVLPEDVQLQAQRPNIFVLYEQNIGLLQPLIAEELRDAEREFPPEWIEEAFRIAVENNVRRWKYVRAILDRWAQEGKEAPAYSMESAEARRRYIEGKYADLIEH
ncbi:MAG TPA: DnaD domain protein, partial [Anaerolineae bacterium]|nr:DnaD domain protein [Anaerolineae bacterium]